ncbi:hypothetical protein SDC9_137552 [bioreactor metagenome]|uniref:Uncharacterized protein n=1 Tax=bioreactor metagenome TaxID=1076179 RepID=A0A645DME8_9ZZZZ
MPHINVYLNSHLKYINANITGTPKSKYKPYPNPVERASIVITMKVDDNIAASVNFFTELFNFYASNFMPPKTSKLNLVYHFLGNLSVIIYDIG